MRYIKFGGDTGFWGCEFTTYEIVDDSISDDELDEAAYEYAVENAEQYEYLVDDEEPDALDEYYNDVSSYWEEVSKEEYEENA